MENKKYYSESFQFYIDSPFIGTHSEIEETLKVVYECIGEIQKSSSIRHIVIETWLVIDYFIRDALGQAFGFNKFNTEEYDLRQKVLPISFDTCLDVFEELLKIQRSLPKNPQENELVMPGGFWSYMVEEDNKLFQDFLEFLNRYYLKFHPELMEYRNEQKLIQKEEKKFQANSAWLDTYEIINEDWIKKARKINKARNSAAHSHDQNKILKQLGINGSNAFVLAKDECLKLIERLLGVNKFES